ncbi:MAG TPA: phosphoribosylpyrophosphate synthetase [Mucilaginibacter sp.]
MKQKFHYATITEAIEQLHEQGYTLDFNLQKDKLVADGREYTAADFEIADLYRYEGQSDPGDEATVYALASVAGVKGLLVSGYGISSESESEETIKQLHYKYLQANS